MLSGSSTYYQSLGEWRLSVFTFSASIFFPQPGAISHQHDGRYSQVFRPRFWPHPTTCTASALPPSGKPPTLHQQPVAALYHNRLSMVTTITAPSRARPMCLKIGLKSEAILIFSGFLAKNYFLQRNGADRYSCLTPSCPTILSKARWVWLRRKPNAVTFVVSWLSYSY